MSTYYLAVNIGASSGRHARRPGNPKDKSVEDLKELFRKLM